jgi:hypothetical protein
MNKQIILQNLQTLGLDEIESQIYFTLLSKGERTPLELARITNINRSKIYRYVENLANKKLLETSKNSWGKKLKASPPDNLEILIHEKEQEIRSQKEILPETISNLETYFQKTDSTFEIKHYHGKEGLKQMLWNELNCPDLQLLVFGFETRNEIAGKSFAEKLRMEQVLRKIKFFEIENTKDQGDFWYTDIPNWRQYYESRYISEEVLKIQHQMAIYDQTVAIFNWKDGIDEGIEIISPIFSQMQRQIFWKFWELAKSG